MKEPPEATLWRVSRYHQWLLRNLTSNTRCFLPFSWFWSHLDWRFDRLAHYRASDDGMPEL